MNQEYRILGPPGTGKTESLKGMVERTAEAIGGHAVMIVSYTTAAAAEISSRVLTVPEDNIGTLHKMCFRAIGTPPVVEGKAKLIKEWNEFAPVYAMSAGGRSDLHSGPEAGESLTLGDRLMATTNILRNKLIDRDDWPLPEQRFFDAWKSWKASCASIDYTDMLEQCLDGISTAPGNPRVIYVDETQDCTALQLAVLKKWAGSTEQLVMVGDGDQCIYQFAGAQPEVFEAGTLGENDSVLRQSYRVPRAVWERATAWIAKVTDRIGKEYLPKPGDPGFVSRCPSTWKDGRALADLCFKAISKRKTIMVIGSCSYMIEPVKKTLTDAGLPFHNPYKLARADWNPLKLTVGTTYAERVKAIFAPQLRDHNWWTLAELKDFAECLKADGVFVKGMKGKLKALDNFQGIGTMFDFFTEAAVNAMMHFDIDWWEANLVNDEARRKAAYPLKIVRNLGACFLDAAELPPEIIIGTIHSVKGGEADIVVVIPDLSQEGMQEWTGSGKSAIRRLMYVAMTRAKEGLIICKPASQYTCDL